MIALVYGNIQDELAKESVWEKILTLQIGPLIGAMAVYKLSLVLSAVQWWYLLKKQNIEIQLMKVIRYYFVGLFFSNFLLGNVGGDVKKVYDIHKESERLTGSVTATLFDRVFGLYVITLISILSGYWWFSEQENMADLVIPSLLIFLAMTLFFIGLFSRRMGNQFDRLFKVGSRLHLTEKYRNMRECFQNYRSPKFLAFILSFSFLIQFLRIYTQVLMAESMGITMDLSYYLYFVPLIGIATSLPISIGGWGPRELVAQDLFMRAGWSGFDAVFHQVLGYFIGLALSLFGAFEFVFGRKVKKKAESANGVVSEG